MSNANTKYGVKPDVLKKIKFTPRDKRLFETGNDGVNNTLIQGIVGTAPEMWSPEQLHKAKRLGLNEMTAEQLRHYLDNEFPD